MTDLAKLVVRLEAQSSQLITELEKANRKIDRFASQTSKTLSKWAGGLIGVFSARALLQFGASVIKAQDDLNDMAQKSGESVETLSRLGYAASQSGADVESLGLGLKALSKSASAAADGSKEAIKAFASVGVSIEGANGKIKTSQELLLDLADEFSRYEDGLQKSARAQAIFGKSGDQLIPFLNKGRAGIEELTRKADQLGITLSTKGAKAADDFGDQMNTLGAIARGVVGKALAEVLPIVTKLTGSLYAGAEGSERWDKAARVLAAGMKILLTTGTVVGEIFDRVGSAIGAAAASLTALAKGNIKEAYSIIVESNKDLVSSVQESAQHIGDIWSDTGDTLVDDLSEVEVKVRKIFNTDVSEGAEKLRKQLEAAGKALTENVATPYEKLQEKIKTADQLLAAHVITLDTWKRAVASAANEVDPFLGAIARMGEGVRDLGEGLREELMVKDAGLTDEIERSIDDINKKFDKQIEEQQKKLDTFTDEARRNTQDILAQGLEDAIHDGVGKGAEGALAAFGRMLERMALQAIAAKLAEKIFGAPKAAGGPSGGGGWLDAAISAVGAIFGGTRDVGGRGSRGQAVLIGRGAQPEMFVPDSAGQYIPRDEWMGGRGQRITQNIYTTYPVTQRSARQMQIEAARNQRTATARLS